MKSSKFRTEFTEACENFMIDEVLEEATWEKMSEGTSKEWFFFEGFGATPSLDFQYKEIIKF